MPCIKIAAFSHDSIFHFVNRKKQEISVIQTLKKTKKNQYEPCDEVVTLPDDAEIGVAQGGGWSLTG